MGILFLFRRGLPRWEFHFYSGVGSQDGNFISIPARAPMMGISFLLRRGLPSWEFHFYSGEVSQDGNFIFIPARAPIMGIPFLFRRGLPTWEFHQMRVMPRWVTKYWSSDPHGKLLRNNQLAEKLDGGIGRNKVELSRKIDISNVENLVADKACKAIFRPFPGLRER